MKLKVLIVEDDPITAHDLSEVLSAKKFEVSGICKSYKEAWDNFKTQRPEIILADIQLKGEKDGVDLIRDINNTYSACPVVYLTGNSDMETKTRAFDTNPAVFLIKPFNSETVIASLELAFEKFNKLSVPNATAPNSNLFVKKGDQFIKIQINEILALKAEGSYCKLFSTDDGFLISGNLKFHEHKLALHFIRVHRSYLVNKNKVTTISANEILVENQPFPIGRKYKEEVKRKFL